MTETWTTEIARETWTLESNPAITFVTNITAASTGGGGGTGDVVGPSSSTDGAPALFNGTTGKLIKVGATNTANGLVKLDGMSVIPESLIPSSIARDSELSDYVAKSTYDANTVLAATSDNTPAALTVAEQTLLGRITGGNIAALTATQVRTLLSLETDTDGTLAANSDSKIATQKATKTYVDRLLPLVKVSDETLASDTASYSVSLSGYEYYLVTIRARGTNTGASNVALRGTFNSDSGTNYSNNASSLISYFVWGNIAASQTNTNRWGVMQYMIAVGSSAVTVATPLGIGTYVPSSGTAATGTSALSNMWQGSVSNALTSVQFFCSSGNIAAGSRITIAGLA